jgi:hypothetical protein
VGTGNGRTEDGGLTRNEENVIRLPREWLGPPEELVPIGPAARERAAQRNLEDGMPPTADAFWSEDSAALHDAVQAPPAVTREHLDPPVGLVPPVAGLRIPALGRLPRLRSVGAAGRVSRWWGLLAVPIATLLVVAVIGTAESPASHPRASHSSVSRGTAAAQVTSTPQAASNTAAAAKFKADLQNRQRSTVRHRAHARAREAHPAKTRDRVVSHHSAGSSAPTVTEAAPSDVATHPSPPAPTVSVPSASTASTHVSEGSTPAPGPAGPNGIGSFSGRCNPKCP